MLKEVSFRVLTIKNFKYLELIRIMQVFFSQALVLRNIPIDLFDSVLTDFLKYLTFWWKRCGLCTTYPNMLLFNLPIIGLEMAKSKSLAGPIWFNCQKRICGTKKFLHIDFQLRTATFCSNNRIIIKNQYGSYAKIAANFFSNFQKRNCGIINYNIHIFNALSENIINFLQLFGVILYSMYSDVFKMASNRPKTPKIVFNKPRFCLKKHIIFRTI